MIDIFTKFLMAVAFSFLVTPVIRIVAKRQGWFASRNLRTIHNELIPNIGGVGILVAFLLPLLMTGFDIPQAVPLLAAACLIAAVGFYDDIRQVNCLQKLSWQIIAALAATWYGFRIEAVSLPFSMQFALGAWTIPASVFWIVLLTNAFNLLDGIDGLASALSINVALFISIASFMVGEIQLALVSVVLMGAITGFVKYNLPPAKIFMGDTGSLFLGFVLGCLAIKAFAVTDNGVHGGAMIALFLVPLSDTTLAVIRRVYQRKSPFSADKEHIHHCLMRLGISQASIVLRLTVLAIVCGFTSITMTLISARLQLFLVCGLLALTFFFFLKAGCFKFLMNKSSTSLNDDILPAKTTGFGIRGLNGQSEVLARGYCEVGNSGEEHEQKSVRF